MLYDKIILVINVTKYCVYTCITGNYDNIVEIDKKEKDFDYICYTNNKKLKSKSWNIKYIEDEQDLDNVKLARKIKILGTEELKKYDVVIWIDGQVKFDTSIKDFIDEYVELDKYDMVGFKHYCRTTVNEEMNSCLEIGKEKLNNINSLYNYLNNKDFKDDLGLLESTIIFRNFNNKSLNKSMKLWFDLIKKYSKRDQLSFPYAAQESGLKCKLLDINIWDNKYFHTIGHSINGKIEYTTMFLNDDKCDFNKVIEGEIVDNKLMIKVPANCDTVKLVIRSDKFIKLNGNIEVHFDKEIENYALNYTQCDGFKIFYGYVLYYIKGNFKKNDQIELYFDIELVDNNGLVKILNKYTNTFEELKKLQNKYDIVVNSRGWKFLERLRKIRRKLFRK